jgi:hypothetical protein
LTAIIPPLRRLVAAVCVLLAAAPVGAVEARSPFPDAVGLMHVNAVKHFDGLSETAAIARYQLPEPGWTWFRDSGLELFADARLGHLQLDRDQATTLSAGLGVRWAARRTGIGTLFVEFGFSPTLVFGNRRFNGDDLGGPLEFTSHAAIGLRPAVLPNLDIAWRIQHISNGRLYSINPGADMIGVFLLWHL